LKTIGHSSKNLGPSENSSPPLMSQVGYGLALSSSDVDFEIFEVLGTTVTKICYVKLLF